MQLGVEGAFLAASGYLGMLLLAWTLGPEDFGLYGVIITLLVWLERTTMLGIPSAVTKLVAEGEEAAAPTSMLISVVLIAGGRDRDLGSCSRHGSSPSSARTGTAVSPGRARRSLLRDVPPVSRCGDGREEVHRCFLVGSDPWVCQATCARLDPPGRPRHFRRPDRLYRRIGRCVLVPRHSLALHSNVLRPLISPEASS